MSDVQRSMAQQVAEAASALQLQQTGRSPQGVTVVLGEDTLVITMQGVLTPAERALASNPEGAAQLHQFHRELFAGSTAALQREIMRITGVEIRDSAFEVDVSTGSVVHAFTKGTVVQVFLLSEPLPTQTWRDDQPLPEPPPDTRPAQSVPPAI